MVKISKLGAEKIIFDEQGLPMFRRCENRDCSTTKDYTPEEKGYVKQLDVSVIQRKEYFSERTFEEKVAYFLITFRCNMPHDRNLKLCYFYYDPKKMSNVCVRNFAPNSAITTSINVLNTESQAYYNIKQVSKKRISEGKARMLVTNREVLPCEFNDSGETGSTTSY
jgi:hypothetical protein